MNRNTGKPETMEPDAGGLLRILDLELGQKRAQWQRALSRHRTSRVVCIASILLVITAAFFALSILFSQLQEERPQKRASTISDNAGR
jgi:hypothetical protein